MKTKVNIALVVLVLTALACQVTGGIPFPEPAPAAPALAPLPAPGADSQETLVALYARVSPGVVSIRIYDDQNNPLSQGSGFVYDGQGHIVTNFHVIEGASQVEVDFPSGFKVYGTIVGTDLDSDLAVVRVQAPAEELHPLPLGDSEQLLVGQTVVAIGNPFGLDGSMTIGIVSALGRSLDSAHSAPSGGFFTAGDIIQTDAAINPGNSGGPLLNLRGEVIGVNRAIRTTNYTNGGEPLNSGIGFAIAINIVKRVVPELVATGRYDYPYLGVGSIDDLDLATIQALGLPRNTGAYVTNVVSGGPADQGGLRAGTLSSGLPGLPAGGDLIIAIDGREVKRFEDLLRYLINYTSPGDQIVLTVIRADGSQADLNVTLGKRP